MRSTVLVVMAITMLTLVGCGDKKQEARGAEDDKYIEIMDSIDLNKKENTALNVKTAWEKLKGQEVTWEMEVVDVKDGRGKVEIHAKKEGKPVYKGGYNIIVTSHDKEKAGALKKGETIKIRGMFESLRQRKGGPQLLYIGSAEVLD